MAARTKTAEPRTTRKPAAKNLPAAKKTHAGARAAKKPNAKPNRVTLRSYDVGFGDCYLLTFHYAAMERHVLIDFGSTRLPKDKVGTGNYMERVAKRIAEDCGGKLHAVVATHRHKDHISGFAMKNGKGPGAIIRALNPELVIQPWTEDPEARRDATKPSKNLSAARVRRALHVGALADMNRYAGFVVESSRRLKGAHLKGLREQLEFLGDDNELANRDAITNLMTMSPKRSYVYFGAKSGLDALLPGVTTRVLGPPTLDQTRSIAVQRSSDKDQFWHLNAERAGFWSKRAAIAAAPEIAFAPLFPDHVEKRPPWDAGWYRYHAQREHAESMLSIVRSLDDQMNNTSLILLFEVGRKLLLFPGDAQYENWMYALAQPGMRKLLGKVSLYKVGHHGSLNATPRDLWSGFAQRGTKRGADRLMSFLSTCDNVHGSEDRHTEVPRRPLVDALSEESELHDTRRLRNDEYSIVRTIPV